MRRRECDDKAGPSVAAMDHAQKEAAPTESRKRVVLPFVKVFDQDKSRMEIRIRRVGSSTLTGNAPGRVNTYRVDQDAAGNFAYPDLPHA